MSRWGGGLVVVIRSRSLPQGAAAIEKAPRAPCIH